MDLQGMVKLCKTDKNAQWLLWEELKQSRYYCYRTFAKFTNDYDDLEQEAYILFSKNLEKYSDDKQTTFKTYYIKNLVNLIKTANRTARRRESHVNLLQQDQLYCLENKITSLGDMTSEEHILGELYVQKIMDKLSPSNQKLLKQLIQEDKRIIDISREEGISYTKLDSQKRRLIEKILKIIDEK